MSFASRLSLALPLLAAVVMTPAGNAATACAEPGSKLWRNTVGPTMHARALALTRACPLDCRTHGQAGAPEGSEREAHAPLPLSIVTRAEDVADWHAGIFERLSGERLEEAATRYCGVALSVPQRRL